jgi:hypothetical protein
VLTLNRFLFAGSQHGGYHTDGIYILLFGHFHYKLEILSSNYFELMLKVKLTKVVKSNEYETIT